MHFITSIIIILFFLYSPTTSLLGRAGWYVIQSDGILKHSSHHYYLYLKGKTAIDETNEDEHLLAEQSSFAQDRSINATFTYQRSTVIRPKRPVHASVNQAAEEASFRLAQARLDPTLLTNATFAQRKDLHPSTIRAITEILRLEQMTEVQFKTYFHALHGSDILGRARTGSGKTLAFLVPSIERMIEFGDPPGQSIGMLIMSPNRELTTQIAEQARLLLTFHDPGRMSVHDMYGGTKLSRDMSYLNHHNNRLPAILVATPGRLLDHLQHTKLKGGKRFADVMNKVRILVLDESDRLLDSAFREEVRKVISYLPKRRQTLMFSATLPTSVKNSVKEIMKPDYVTVDCVSSIDGNSDKNNNVGHNKLMETNLRVSQSHVVLSSSEQYFSSVIRVVQFAMDQEDNYKIIAFFPTARITGFFAHVLNEILRNNIPVFELHSRKRQGFRSKTSEEFSQARKGILVTSDVSARGVDYPDVTHVIQFGVPASRDTYIHRLGRTGRAGKEGRGWLVLSPFESKFVKELRGLHVPLNTELNALLSNSYFPMDTEERIAEVVAAVSRGDKKHSLGASLAYQSFLGFYHEQMKRLDIKSSKELVMLANTFAKQVGLSEKNLPEIDSRLAARLSLCQTDGIRIKEDRDSGEDPLVSELL